MASYDRPNRIAMANIWQQFKIQIYIYRERDRTRMVYVLSPQWWIHNTELSHLWRYVDTCSLTLLLCCLQELLTPDEQERTQHWPSQVSWIESLLPRSLCNFIRDMANIDGGKAKWQFFGSALFPGPYLNYTYTVSHCVMHAYGSHPRMKRKTKRKLLF